MHFGSFDIALIIGVFITVIALNHALKLQIAKNDVLDGLAAAIDYKPHAWAPFDSILAAIAKKRQRIAWRLWETDLSRYAPDKLPDRDRLERALRKLVQKGRVRRDSTIDPLHGGDEYYVYAPA